MNDHDRNAIERDEGTEAEDEFDDLDDRDAGSGDGYTGNWFVAGFDSEASCCPAEITEGDTIRADGSRGWEHRDCVEGPYQDRDVIDFSGPMLGW